MAFPAWVCRWSTTSTHNLTRRLSWLCGSSANLATRDAGEHRLYNINIPTSRSPPAEVRVVPMARAVGG